VYAKVGALDTLRNLMKSAALRHAQPCGFQARRHAQAHGSGHGSTFPDAIVVLRPQRNWAGRSRPDIHDGLSGVIGSASWQRTGMISISRIGLLSALAITSASREFMGSSVDGTCNADQLGVCEHHAGIPLKSTAAAP
jgi:hypothetical protein